MGSGAQPPAETQSADGLDSREMGRGIVADGDAPWVSAERMREIFDSVCNWGRWGPDDEAGALNLITPERRRAAAAEVRMGLSVSCARELPVEPSPENPRPALHLMTRAGDDCIAPGLGLESTGDFVGVAFHGMATSHIDALCHVFVDGRMYNGFPGSEVRSTGARRGSILCARDGVVGRGVLLDVPRLHGVRYLEPGTAVTADELDAAERAQDVTVGEGDILLVATGRDARRAELGPWAPFAGGLAGLHPECLPWLHQRGVAVLGCDGVSDTLPGRPPEGWVDAHPPDDDRGDGRAPARQPAPRPPRRGVRRAATVELPVHGGSAGRGGRDRLTRQPHRSPRSPLRLDRRRPSGVDDDEEQVGLAGELPGDLRPAAALAGPRRDAGHLEAQVDRVARFDLAAEAGPLDAAEQAELAREALVAPQA